MGVLVPSALIATVTGPPAAPVRRAATTVVTAGIVAPPAGERTGRATTAPRVRRDRGCRRTSRARNWLPTSVGRSRA
ncbi:hypothetical protein FHR75_002953 [Kineococcus radiotolerans]|uniref:Uncharacterized protein n=1 Tax=Kineococcus radiotolerans TaxID=131568 RepID=A0A7W4TND8_KINRA|nr:hypothetical protein [Kineococcus radiotolerans]